MKTFKQYLKKILEVSRRRDAREESYYSTLETLLNEFAKSTNRKDIYVTSQPKKTDAGNPDFRVWDGKQKIVGYIEAKTPDKNLDDVEKTEQVKRYKTTFPNFMLTNFLEFRFYRDGSLVDKVRIADPMAIYSLKGFPRIENKERIESLLEKFFSYSFPSITSAEPLAVELAKRTRFLCDEVIAEEIREEEKVGTGNILGFYEAFQTYLIKGLTKEQFADLYSQTITYGLFASRMRHKGDFNRKNAFFDIPYSIGILRDIFRYLSLEELPLQLEWIVDEISNVLANVNVKKIFSQFREQKGNDPVFHFYETFLEKYDPKEKERRGVYYTPEPVVSYIVRSLHKILINKFGLEDGLASENVTILDPAAGTLTFIVEAIKEAMNEFTLKWGEGAKKEFIKEHIMKNFYAFELMIAPYAMGHLKISFLLDELGYKLQENERVKFYLTNTLELEDIEQTALPGMASLAEESRKAGEVKKKTPILIILGNPPYSSISANMGKWISDLIEPYKYVDGEHFGEKKHWLHDDYVKFIRFAEWKINQSGKGIIGYITNRGYSENPTFRGMRQQLMNSFDEIYFLDLHGGGVSDKLLPAIIGEDENVFDIMQGVGISFFVKTGNIRDECRVQFKEISGSREKKYSFLLSNDVETINWEEIQPKSPFYFFFSMKEEITELYNTYWKITSIFPVNNVGFMTSRNNFVLSFDKETLQRRFQKFYDLSIPSEKIKKIFKIRNNQAFQIDKIRNKRRFNDDSIKKCIFKPFDERYIYYEKDIVQRWLFRIMQHMLQKNLGLITARSNKSTVMDHFFCTRHIKELKCAESTTGSSLFPLYQYSEGMKKTNLNKGFLKMLETTYDRNLRPEEIFYYVYAIFFSNIYRNKYLQNLRLSFPRVPITSNYRLFLKMGKLGKDLVDLHLLESGDLAKPIARLQGEGKTIVDKPTFNGGEERIYINESKYFEGVEEDIWEYTIGGYQVLYLWLKYRRGRELSIDDIKHFCRVVTALKKTIEIQDEIDKAYPNVEKDVIPFKEDNLGIEKYTK